MSVAQWSVGMKEETELAPYVKHCPICTQELPISEFGICRARKDGRNLYCKSCIRNKVTQSRRALKEYKSARQKYIARQVELSELVHPDQRQYEIVFSERWGGRSTGRCTATPAAET